MPPYFSNDSSYSGMSIALRNHGWCLIELLLNDTPCSSWESIFAAAFAQSLQDKESAGVYRGKSGVSVGFRKEDAREFFDTRMHSHTHSCTHSESELEPKPELEPEPCYGNVDGYAACTRTLFSVLSKTTEKVLNEIAVPLELNPRCFLDLTDIGVTTVAEDDTLSSSLLRICYYPSSPSTSSSPSIPSTPTDSSDSSVAFGAHTDTSFVTLGLCSSNAGLEVFDHETMQWVRVEELDIVKVAQARGKSVAVVFIGEFLQVLSKGYYYATTHRVRSPASGSRISCPFIVRGRNRAVINLRDIQKYKHPGGIAAVEAHAPDLDGTTMKLLHHMLDVKRQRCLRENQGQSHDWVLAAYPPKSKS